MMRQTPAKGLACRGSQRGPQVQRNACEGDKQILFLWLLSTEIATSRWGGRTVAICARRVNTRSCFAFNCFCRDLSGRVPDCYDRAIVKECAPAIGGCHVWRNTFAIIAVLLMASPVWGESWADRLFSEKEHDFGETPRGAIREHRFALTNPYRYPVRIQGVHASCGCVTAEAECEHLHPQASGAVIVRWEAKAAAGEQSPTVTIEFDKPFAAQVQLALRGRVVDDLLVEPARVEFGTVAKGEASTREVLLSSTLERPWRITEITTQRAYLKATIAGIEQHGEETKYRLQVELSADAPDGYLLDTITIHTDPPRVVPWQIDVVGRITKSLSVSPEALSFGSLQPGQQVTRRLVVRGRQPFRIAEIKTKDAGLVFDFDAEAIKEVHVVRIKFTAPENAGTILRRVTLTTDVDQQVAEFSAHALVLEK